MSKARKVKPPAPAGEAQAPGDPLPFFPLMPLRPTARAGAEKEPAGEAGAADTDEAAKRLEMIRELAGLQFDPADIAIVAQVKATDMTGGDKDATAAYDSGRLLAEARVRQMLLRMALAGSAVAQKMILDIADNNKRKASDGQAAGPDAAELDAVRSHLGKLDLAPAGAPVTELARLAALRIITLEGKTRRG